MSELCLFQHVHEFTRFRNGQQPSCLDYVFTSEDNVVQDLQYESPLGKSDHVVLTWNSTVHAEELNSHLKKYNYWKDDYRAIAQHLGDVDWFDVFLGKSANEMWSYFKEVVTTLMDGYIPLKSAKFCKKKGHWLKSTTVNMINKRDAAWKKYIRFKSTANFDRYKSIRNTVNSMVRADGVAYR